MTRIDSWPAVAVVPGEAARAVLHHHNGRLSEAGATTLLCCNGFNCEQHGWHQVAPGLAADY